MKIAKLYLFIFLCIAVGPQNSAQAQHTANQMLRGVYQKLNKVKDYSADAEIKADIPLIKILPVKATVYFKQPDRFKLLSKGIAILPRQGVNDLTRIIRDSLTYTAVLTGKELLGKTKAVIVSVIPASDTGELVLAKFWIDEGRSLIIKSQLTTRSNGTISVEYTYGALAPYGLPDKMYFTVDVKQFKMPKQMASDSYSKPKTTTKQQTPKTGSILVEFKNYKLNQGLKNSFFDQKK
jgi:hypothetical protein